MINPIRDKIVGFSGPIVRHAHVIGEGEAYVTVAISAHATEAFISGVYLVTPNRKLRLASASDIHKRPYEVFRIPRLRVAVARMHKDPLVKVAHVHMPHDLLRFLYREDDESPKHRFDVRFSRLHNVSVSADEAAIVEAHVIKGVLTGKYEKIRLRYDHERNVVSVREEEREYPIID